MMDRVQKAYLIGEAAAQFEDAAIDFVTTVPLVVLRRRLPGLLVVDRVLPFAVDRGSARVDEQAALLALVLGSRPFSLAERLRGVP